MLVRWASARIYLAAIVVLLASFLTTPSALAQASGEAQLAVIQGIPNVTVDVTVDGAEFAVGLEAEQIAEAAAVPAGSHTIVATDAATGDELAEATLTLPDASHVSVVLHVDTDGTTPVIAAFPNDLTAVKAGEGRLIARHLSDLPAVDVLADGAELISEFTPGEEAKLDVPADTYSVAVRIPPDPAIAFGPLELEVREGEATIVHVIGAGEGAFAPYSVVLQRIDGIGSQPGGIDTGNSGLLQAPTDEHGSPMRLVMVLVMVVGSAVVGAVLLRRRPQWETVRAPSSGADSPG